MDHIPQRDGESEETNDEEDDARRGRHGPGSHKRWPGKDSRRWAAKLKKVDALRLRLDLRELPTSSRMMRRWRDAVNVDMVSAIVMETSWLFIRRHETVRVFRPGPAWLHVAIEGPGGLRSALRFATEEELQDFQASHEQQLIADGWHLAGTNVERRSGSDRRGRTRGRDRRSVNGGNGGKPGG